MDASISHDVIKPNIANASQELSKVIDDMNQAALFEMHHLIKYVLITRSIGSKLEPKGSEKKLGIFIVSVEKTMKKTQTQ